MDILAVALWAGALGGVVAVVVAAASPARRRVALLVAAVLFLPIGILGIMTIGALFLAGALACVVAAVLTRGGTPAPSSSPNVER